MSKLAKFSPFLAALALAVPAAASAHADSTRSCKPTPIEREQNGVKTITTNTSCKTAVYLASFTSLPRGDFDYAGRTWIGYTLGKGRTFRYVYMTQTLTPTLKVTVTY